MILFFVIIILFCDFFLKAFIINNFNCFYSYIFCDRTLLNVFFNSGCFFGCSTTCTYLYQNFFICFCTSFLVVIFYFCLHYCYVYKVKKIGLFFILVGGIGNVCDRLFYGYVIDFIDIYMFGFNIELHWYIFNLSDILLVIGCLFLIL